MGKSTNEPGAMPASTEPDTVKPMKRAFGALPPEHLKWMTGKTVAEIEAINDEAYATGKSSAEVAAGNEWKKRLEQADTEPPEPPAAA